MKLTAIAGPGIVALDGEQGTAREASGTGVVAAESYRPDGGFERDLMERGSRDVAPYIVDQYAVNNHIPP